MSIIYSELFFLICLPLAIFIFVVLRNYQKENHRENLIDIERQQIALEKLIVQSYEKTDYFQQTQISYWDLQLDNGKLGEYRLGQLLKQVKGYKKILFNLYLLKANGDTTEIDLVMIHPTGIYVFESKNYKGWIFDNEKHQRWTQVLYGRHGRSTKYPFFNPIKQNQGHLKWLAYYLNQPNIPLHSYIVFSDDCSLKQITLTSKRHRVVQYSNLLSNLASDIYQREEKLSESQIDYLYSCLYPLTERDEVFKTRHNEAIRQRMGAHQIYSPSPREATVPQTEALIASDKPLVTINPQNISLASSTEDKKFAAESPEQVDHSQHPSSPKEDLVATEEDIEKIPLSETSDTDPETPQQESSAPETDNLAVEQDITALIEAILSGKSTDVISETDSTPQTLVNQEVSTAATELQTKSTEKPAEGASDSPPSQLMQGQSATIQTVQKSLVVATLPSEKVCPRCQSSLVLRTAFRGIHAGQQFWGCSRFPQCRYIKNI